MGEKYSTRRTPQQTETERLWLAGGPIGYHPWERQIAIARKMSVVDSAELIALISVAEADAVQSVFAAKWHYMFWRPMTAIRNGDIDENPRLSGTPPGGRSTSRRYTRNIPARTASSVAR